MKKNGLVIVGLVIVVVIVIFSIKSCNSPSSSDAWAKLDVFDDKLLASNVEKYYDATMGYETETDQVFDVYTEMSMDFGYMAYQMPYNDKFAKDVFSRMSKIHHFKIEKDKIDDGGILNGTDDFRKTLFNKSIYTSTGVNIINGLKQLVKNNRPALLITDFENWQNNSEDKNSAYKDEFKEWLQKPNHSITFYYANFCDESADEKGRVGDGESIMPERFHKRIFFAFFDVDKNKTFSKYAIPVHEEYPDFQKIVVDITPYKINTKYASLSSSGIGMGLENQVTKVLQGLPNPNQKAFEFINIGKYNWEFIDKTIQTKKKEPFFTKLFVDASDNAAFDLNKIGVKVYDVTDDYTFFTRCNYVKNNPNKLNPKFIKDKQGKYVFDPSCDRITKEVYNPTTKKLKPEWIYGIATAKNSPIYQEIFEINNTLVKNTKSESPKRISVETKIHPAYSLNKIIQKNGLLRVDIVAEEVTKNYSSFNKLIWNTPGNDGGKLEENPSLSMSIKDALQDLNKGQVIYSYYIRVAPSKK